jgi:hypothetical protein
MQTNQFTSLGDFTNYASIRILRLGGNNINATLPDSLRGALLMAEFSSNNNM